MVIYERVGVFVFWVRGFLFLDVIYLIVMFGWMKILIEVNGSGWEKYRFFFRGFFVKFFGAMKCKLVGILNLIRVNVVFGFYC